MGYTYASTQSERAVWISHLLAHSGEYGVVTALSRPVRWAYRGKRCTPGPSAAKRP